LTFEGFRCPCKGPPTATSRIGRKVKKIKTYLLKKKNKSDVTAPAEKVIVGDFPTSHVKIYEFSGHCLYTNALLFLLVTVRNKFSLLSHQASIFLTLSYSSKINGCLYPQRVSLPLKNAVIYSQRAMLSILSGVTAVCR
jgi:hypothetical protein